MGAGASKQAARKLPKRAPQVNVGAQAPRILENRPAPGTTPQSGSAGRPEGKDGVPGAENTGEEEVGISEKLQRLGVVQFQEIKQQYSQKNEFLSAVQRRSQLDADIPRELEDRSRPKRFLHPETIRGVIDSRDAGDEPDHVLATYSVDGSVLHRLQKFSAAPVFRKPVVQEEPLGPAEAIHDEPGSDDPEAIQQALELENEQRARAEAIRRQREALKEMEEDPELRQGPLRR